MRKFPRIRRRRALALVGATVVSAIAAAVGLSFYGGSGTGSASASAGHAPRTVSVTGSLDAGDSPLYPGDTGGVTLTISLVGPGSARVGSVTATAIHTSNEPACDPAWFSYTPPAPIVFPNGTNVSAGSPLVIPGGVNGSTLTFIDEDELQDACSDATVTIDLAAAPN